MKLLELLLASLLVVAGAQITEGDDQVYAPIEVQVGQDIFTLQPTSSLVVKRMGADGPGTFTFGPGQLGDGPTSPAEANAAWLGLSGGQPVLAEAFYYTFRCDDPLRNSLPDKLTKLCSSALVEKGGIFIVKSKREGREVGSHREAPNEAEIVGYDGSMTIGKRGRTYWESALADGPVAVACDQLRLCRQYRALSPTTYYSFTFHLPAASFPPTAGEWLALSALVAEAAGRL